MADQDERLVDAVIGASGGQAWLDGPTDAARTARIVISALRACLDARSRGDLVTDHPGPDVQLPAPDPDRCGNPIVLTGYYRCAIELDGESGHDGDCLTQPELDGTWPPPDVQPFPDREEPVIGLSAAVFDVVHRWTMLPPDERRRVTPAIATILDALQEQFLAQLRHDIATPDDEVPGG